MKPKVFLSSVANKRLQQNLLVCRERKQNQRQQERRRSPSKSLSQNPKEVQQKKEQRKSQQPKKLKPKRNDEDLAVYMSSSINPPRNSCCLQNIQFTSRVFLSVNCDLVIDGIRTSSATVWTFQGVSTETLSKVFEKDAFANTMVIGKTFLGMRFAAYFSPKFKA